MTFRTGKKRSNTWIKWWSIYFENEILRNYIVDFVNPIISMFDLDFLMQWAMLWEISHRKLLRHDPLTYAANVDQQDPKHGKQNLPNIQELNYPRTNQHSNPLFKPTEKYSYAFTIKIDCSYCRIISRENIRWIYLTCMMKNERREHEEMFLPLYGSKVHRWIFRSLPPVANDVPDGWNWMACNSLSPQSWNEKQHRE